MKVAKRQSAEEFRARLGRAIKDLRVKRGSDQKQFAEAVGISQGMLSRIENGRADMTVFRANQICEALGTTLCEVLELV